MIVSRTTQGSLAGVCADQGAQRVTRMAEIGFRSSAMVHDLNNLLQIVVGNLDFAARGQCDEKTARHLALARTSLERCTRLARRTLADSRPTDDARPMGLRHVLSEMSERLRAACGGRVVIHVDAGGEDLAIAADEHDLENAILNLVINARDAIAGEGHIRIRSRAAAASVLVEVEDDGPGIPAELREAVLERFFTTKANGTGLGLANVRAFAEAAGGGLTIDSCPGVGTTATLRFPRADPMERHPDEERHVHAG